MCKYVLEDLSNELLPCNTKVVTAKHIEVVTQYAQKLLLQNILKLLHSMHIGNIIKLLYNIYRKILTLKENSGPKQDKVET